MNTPRRVYSNIFRIRRGNHRYLKPSPHTTVNHLPLPPPENNKGSRARVPGARVFSERDESQAFHGSSRDITTTQDSEPEGYSRRLAGAREQQADGNGPRDPISSISTSLDDGESSTVWSNHFSVKSGKKKTGGGVIVKQAQKQNGARTESQSHSQLQPRTRTQTQTRCVQERDVELGKGSGVSSSSSWTFPNEIDSLWEDLEGRDQGVLLSNLPLMRLPTLPTQSEVSRLHSVDHETNKVTDGSVSEFDEEGRSMTTMPIIRNQDPKSALRNIGTEGQTSGEGNFIYNHDKLDPSHGWSPLSKNPGTGTQSSTGLQDVYHLHAGEGQQEVPLSGRQREEGRGPPIGVHAQSQSQPLSQPAPTQHENQAPPAFDKPEQGGIPVEQIETLPQLAIPPTSPSLQDQLQDIGNGDNIIVDTQPGDTGGGTTIPVEQETPIGATQPVAEQAMETSISFDQDTSPSLLAPAVTNAVTGVRADTSAALQITTVLNNPSGTLPGGTATPNPTGAATTAASVVLSSIASPLASPSSSESTPSETGSTVSDSSTVATSTTPDPTSQSSTPTLTSPTSTASSNTTTNQNPVSFASHSPPFYIGIILGSIVVVSCLVAFIAWFIRMRLQAKRKRQLEEENLPWTFLNPNSTTSRRGEGGGFGEDDDEIDALAGFGDRMVRPRLQQGVDNAGGGVGGYAFQGFGGDTAISAPERPRRSFVVLRGKRGSFIGDSEDKDQALRRHINGYNSDYGSGGSNWKLRNYGASGANSMTLTTVAAGVGGLAVPEKAEKSARDYDDGLVGHGFQHQNQHLYHETTTNPFEDPSSSTSSLIQRSASGHTRRENAEHRTSETVSPIHGGRYASSLGMLQRRSDAGQIIVRNGAPSRSAPSLVQTGSIDDIAANRGFGPLHVTNMMPGDAHSDSDISSRGVFRERDGELGADDRNRFGAVIGYPLDEVLGTPREAVPGLRPRFLGLEGGGLKLPWGPAPTKEPNSTTTIASRLRALGKRKGGSGSWQQMTEENPINPRRNQSQNSQEQQPQDNWKSSFKWNLVNAFNAVASSLPNVSNMSPAESEVVVPAPLESPELEEEEDNYTRKPVRHKKKDIAYNRELVRESSGGSTTSKGWSLEEMNDGAGVVHIYELGSGHGSREGSKTPTASDPARLDAIDGGQRSNLQLPDRPTLLSRNSSVYSMASASSSALGNPPRLPLLSRTSTMTIETGPTRAPSRVNSTKLRPKLSSRASSSTSSAYSNASELGGRELVAKRALEDRRRRAAAQRNHRI